MSVFVHVECKCGNNILQDTFDDLERALYHLRVLYRECGEEVRCVECESLWQEKLRAEDSHI